MVVAALTISDAGHGHVPPHSTLAQISDLGLLSVSKDDVDDDCEDVKLMLIVMAQILRGNIHNTVQCMGKVTNVDPVLVSKQVFLFERFKQASFTKRFGENSLNVHPLALLTSLSAAAASDHTPDNDKWRKLL